jgi:carbon-monoxide dehydrogenase large subunit
VDKVTVVHGGTHRARCRRGGRADRGILIACGAGVGEPDLHVAEHTYAPGIQVAVVEVAVESGRVDVLEYATAQDVRRAINPGIVEGQLIGGTAQGLGGALLEHFAYDESGQPLATSLMDYLLPSALRAPPEHRVAAVEDYPSRLNPLGVRGVGDAGPAGVAAAVANAVADALRDFDVRANGLPLWPDRVLAEIRASGSASDGNLE